MSQNSDNSLSLRQRMAQAAAELHRPQALAGAALLAGLHLILNQFTLPLGPYLEVGFDFLSTAVTGFLYGPWVAGLSGIITDLLGHILHPTGPYFPGWTLSAILMGMLYGLLYFRRPIRLGRVVVTRLIMVAVFNFFLTPFWLHLMYGQAFILLSSLRIFKNILKFPIDLGLEYFFLKLADREVLRRRP